MAIILIQTALQKTDYCLKTVKSYFSSILLGGGWLFSNPWVWLCGMWFYEPISAKKYRAGIQVLLLACLYHHVFHHALEIVYASRATYVYLLSVFILYGLWWSWFSVMDMVAKSFPSRTLGVWFWLCLSEKIWQICDIGIYRTTPMLSVWPFDGLVVSMKALALPLFFLIAASRHLLINILFVSALCFIPVDSPKEKWDQKLDLFAEGEVRDAKHPSAILPVRDYAQGRYYSSFQGVGAYTGVARKRHLVPWAESNYSPGMQSRLICADQCHLLLICYDVFFDDWIVETKGVGSVMVVSNLRDFLQTPMLGYFEKQLKYLHLRSGKPVIYRDQIRQFELGISEVY